MSNPNILITIALIIVIGMPTLGSIMRSHGVTPPEWRYFKPFSMTWWVGAIPAAVGAFIAGEPVHGFAAWADAFTTMTGGTDPGTLIMAGLGAIGLRGKDG